MCAGAKFKHGKNEIDIYLGYHGCNASIGDKTFYANSDDAARDHDSVTCEEFKSILGEFTKEDLIDIFIKIVREGEEY